MVIRDLTRVFRDPLALLEERLHESAAPSVVFVTTVTPLAAIRSLAVLLPSLFGGTPMAGFVLALGSFALQVGTWLGLALVLPALARQFRAEVTDRQAFALATWASSPLWLAGLFFAVPPEPAIFYWWSRLVVWFVAVYSFYIVHRGLLVLEVRRSMRMPLLGGIIVASMLFYWFLFVILGIASHLVLLIVGSA